MTTRARASIVAVLAVLVFFGCVALMLGRIGADLRAHPPNYFLFREVTGTNFSFAGRGVSLTDKVLNTIPYLTLTYGDAAKDLLVAKRASRDLPGLADHSEWLRVLRFVDSTGMRSEESLAKMEAGELADRLIIVTKSLRPGVNQETWGVVWKKDWEFDFYELTPGGEIAHERLGYPTTKHGEPAKPNELVEGTWQFVAALHLMPKGGPTMTFDRSPIEAAGWTLPVAALCGVVLLGCVVAGYRRPEETKFQRDVETK